VRCGVELLLLGEQAREREMEVNYLAALEQGGEPERERASERASSPSAYNCDTKSQFAADAPSVNHCDGSLFLAYAQAQPQ